MNTNAEATITTEPKIVQTDIGSKDGQNKCPKCGSTDISMNMKTGQLRCNFCRYEFTPEKIQGMETDISHLQGETIGSGAQDISASTDDVITLKCSSCGAEVVIDTANSTQARCHWCRNTLSINQQIPNGAIPDVVLPFKIPKEQAQEEIAKFVKQRKFYAHPRFKKEFTTDNIMGVYFPYMIIDTNAHAVFEGQGEHQTKKYTRGYADNEKTYYDADVYNLGREFDIEIQGLTVESNSDKLDYVSKDKTNNIINSIMPFDTENSAKYNANYLRGFTSEKRDVNIEQLKPLVDAQNNDIIRNAANSTAMQYDRGIKWNREDIQSKGRQWKSAYLPVWLYSYQQKKSNGQSLLHYVAVNARTKETMGSVPVHWPKLFVISLIIEILGIMGFIFSVAATSPDDEDSGYWWLLLLSGFIYFSIMYNKYRNKDARHFHESETKRKISNLQKYDNFVKKETGLSNSRMEGANNNRLDGSLNLNTGTGLVDNIIGKTSIGSTVQMFNKRK